LKAFSRNLTHLEAVSYVSIYLFKGHLPWMGFTAKTTQQTYQMIAHLKQQISVDELCAQMPEEFNKYVNIVRNLEFEDQPKYKIVINMFNKFLSKNGFDPNNQILIKELFSKVDFVSLLSKNNIIKRMIEELSPILISSLMKFDLQ
jgi:hypothetical protein